MVLKGLMFRVHPSGPWEPSTCSRESRIGKLIYTTIYKSANRDRDLSFQRLRGSGIRAQDLRFGGRAQALLTHD